MRSALGFMGAPTDKQTITYRKLSGCVKNSCFCRNWCFKEELWVLVNEECFAQSMAVESITPVREHML